MELVQLLDFWNMFDLTNEINGINLYLNWIFKVIGSLK